jgi:hypothetical protein
MNADDKKILSVKVERLVGAYENEPTDDDDNPIRGFLKRNLGNDEENGDIENDVKEDPAIALNRETAREVERMVDSGSEKRLQLASELEGKKDSRE